MKKIIFMLVSLCLGQIASADVQGASLNCSITGSYDHEFNYQTSEIKSSDFKLQPGSTNTFINNVNLINIFEANLNIYIQGVVNSIDDKLVSIKVVDQVSQVSSSTNGNTARIQLNVSQRKADLAEINQIDIDCHIE